MAAQIHRAIAVGIDMNMRGTAHLLLGKTGLDLGCDYRVPDAYRRLHTVRVCVFSEHRNRGRQGTDDETACRELGFHGLSVVTESGPICVDLSQGLDQSDIRTRNS